MRNATVGEGGIGSVSLRRRGVGGERILSILFCVATGKGDTRVGGLFSHFPYAERKKGLRVWKIFTRIPKAKTLEGSSTPCLSEGMEAVQESIIQGWENLSERKGI